MNNLIAKANSPTEMRDIAARICRDYLTGAWKTISADELQLKRISGGLSNFLYYVSLPEHHYYSNNNNGGTKSNPGSRRGSFATERHTVTKTSSNNKPRNGSKRARKDSCTGMLEPKEVLLRIYGQTHGEHALETMLTESVVFTLLSERKLGPKLHGIFPGGRIEQYIPARALLTAELSDTKISLKVAEKMAAIHSMDIPVSKEPDWIWNTMNRWLKGVTGTLKTLERDRANGNVKKGNGDETGRSDEDERILTEMDLAGEVEWLRSVVESEDFPVVFCHNDLQEGNILLRQDYPSMHDNSYRECTTLDNFDESTQLDSHFSSILISNGVVSNNESINPSDGGNMNLNRISRKRSLDHDSMENDLDNTRDSVLSGNSQALSDANSAADGEPELMIIDFEYCAYNYRGFDLANHFLEYTFDYTNAQAPYFYHKLDQYPSVEQQEKFIVQYLSHLSAPMDDGLEISDRDDPTEEEERPKVSSMGGSEIDEIEQVRREVQCFTMASHLFWSLWAIVNVYQEIEFGYMEYAICRLKQYQQAKQSYIETMHIGSPGEQTPPVDPEK
ncbi:choline/ethanolamine kinase isoform X2 [Anopheles funestus]|uniref:Choline kinase n=1 Tax=Anopheles funestus TaxID=62324 RepID=A0A182RJB8_ANOFN|nr:choline/ethanolamine kinase isoform X2 [Anopheles funestus]